jgi:hypothetical protein
MPGLRGFSGKSIRKMRQFYEAWGGNAIWPSATAKLESQENESVVLPPSTVKIVTDEFLPPLAAKMSDGGYQITAKEFLSISFSHHTEIIDRTDILEERLFYIGETARNIWSKRQLRESIKRDDFNHRGAMPSNFAATIPDAALARKTLGMFRDEYLLDFVNLADMDASVATMWNSIGFASNAAVSNTSSFFGSSR